MEKEKKTQAIDHLGCVGEEDEQWQRSGRRGGTKSGTGGVAERCHLTHLFSLSTSFSISYYRESWIMCWNQVEKEKKKLRKRAGERKREGGSRIKWKVEKNKGRG